MQKTSAWIDNYVFIVPTFRNAVPHLKPNTILWHHHNTRRKMSDMKSHYFHISQIINPTSTGLERARGVLATRWFLFLIEGTS